MNIRYDILESISQREDGALSEENERLVHIANVIGKAARDCRTDEGKPCESSDDVADLNEAEKRAAESFAKANNCWIPIHDIFCLGVPGPSGSESDTYISADGYVYKSNNLLHCQDSIIVALEKFVAFNTIFADCADAFVGFAGFENRSVFPVIKQRHIKGGVPATQNEIDCYMAAIGFEKIERGKFQNDNFIVWDILPKNVLKDETGDIFVIDAEIQYKKARTAM